MMSTHLDLEQSQCADELIDWLRDYASRRINSRLIDARRCLPPHIVLDFGNRGLLGMQVPTTYGGLGLRNRDVVRVLEQLAAIDLTLASLVLDSLLGAHTIFRYATPAFRDEYLPQLARGRLLSAVAITDSEAGSNPRAMTTTARPDGQGGWHLSGTKRWVGYGSWASVVNVYAQLYDEAGRPLGISGFMVPQGAPGMQIGEEAETLGMRGYVKNTLHLCNVPVTRHQMLGEPGAGMEAAQDTMMYVRGLMGAVCLGGIKRCLQLMHRYVSRRSVATGSLLENPMTLLHLGELTAATTAVQALVRQTAEDADTTEGTSDALSVVCKTTASEVLWWAADMLVQFLGARGYDESNMAARMLRDARPFRIFEGPTQTLLMHLGGAALHGDEALFGFLARTDGEGNVAERLRDAVAHIRARHGDTPLGTITGAGALYKAAAATGEVTSEAVLVAVLERECARHDGAQLRRALAWANHRFAQAAAKAVGNPPAYAELASSADLTDLIGAYASDIGDVEQHLPGDEQAVDTLLLRDPVVASRNSVGREYGVRAEPLRAPGQQLASDQWTSVVPCEYPCVHQLIECQVRLTPEATAVCTQQERISYAELNQRANQLAHYLRMHGVEADTLVGLCVTRSIDMLVAVLGILKAGGAYLPLDPTYPAERLAYMMADADVKLLVTESVLLDAILDHRARVINLDRDRADIDKMEPSNPIPVATSRHLAYVIYTSGSTGKPKGVLIEHRSLANLTTYACSAYGLGPRDRVLQFASLSFDAAAEEIYPCLASGATLVLRNDEMLGSATRFMECCDQHGITVLDLPTAFWHQLASEADRLPMVASLRLTIVGGERALGARLRLWRRRFGEQVRLVNTYGPTEGTVIATGYDMTQFDDEQGDPPIGKPIVNVRTHVLSATGKPVPAGVDGELHIGGVALARGYLNRPELTAERFVPDPFSTEHGARLYRTGDTVRLLPDGNLAYVGRIDDQIKIRGFRIEPGEVEAVLAEMEAVAQVTVLVRDTGQADKQLVAYVVPKFSLPRHVDLIAESWRYVRARLPSYMHPAAIVCLPELPILPNGKIDRAALPPPARDVESRLEEGDVAQTPVEDALVQEWSAIFGFTVSRQDNFFELGGHSLLAMQLISRIRDRLALELSWQALFQHSTIEQLAAHIVQKRSAQIQSSGNPGQDMEEVTL